MNDLNPPAWAMEAAKALRSDDPRQPCIATWQLTTVARALAAAEIRGRKAMRTGVMELIEAVSKLRVAAAVAVMTGLDKDTSREIDKAQAVVTAALYAFIRNLPDGPHS